MPRWLKRIRGIIGTGLAFAIGGPIIVAAIGAGFWLFGEAPLLGVLFVAARSAPVSFVIGVVFSGLLALIARGRVFENLSLKLFSALGGGVGAAVFTAMGLNGAFNVWSPALAVVNFTLLTSIGAGAAAATLWIARRARATIDRVDPPLSLAEGPATTMDTARDHAWARPGNR
jgi:hypothetical protein